MQLNLQTVVAMLEEGLAKGDRSKFTWKYYVPYFTELKKRGCMGTFVYLIYLPGKSPEVRQWLQQNSGKVREFLNWSNSHAWPRAEG